MMATADSIDTSRDIGIKRRIAGDDTVPPKRYEYDERPSESSKRLYSEPPTPHADISAESRAELERVIQYDSIDDIAMWLREHNLTATIMSEILRLRALDKASFASLVALSEVAMENDVTKRMLERATTMAIATHVPDADVMLDVMPEAMQISVLRVATAHRPPDPMLAAHITQKHPRIAWVFLRKAVQLKDERLFRSVLRVLVSDDDSYYALLATFVGPANV